MSVGIDCLVRIQTEVVKGLATQAEKTCQTRSHNSVAPKMLFFHIFFQEFQIRANNCGDKTTKTLNSDFKDATSYIENILKVLFGQV
jgi:hypothetical protein